MVRNILGNGICLLPHCAYLSETSRMIEIYRALRSRGVTPRVATYGGTYESALRAAGIEYDLVGPPMDADRCARFLREQPSSGWIGQSAYSDAELRAYALAEAEYFTRHRIGVAVTGFALSTVLSTRLAGVRLVTEHSASWVPPMAERGLFPAPSSPNAFIRSAWLANRLPSRVRFYCGGFNRIARELGVPEIPSVAALVLGDLTLVTEAPEVLGVPAAEIESWRPGRGFRPETRLRVTGPLFAHLPVPLPPEVDAFLSADPPVVYVAITSSPPALIRAVVHALLPLGVRVLVAGTVHDLADLADDRVMVAGVLPSHLVMPRAALAVTAGGQGSVQTAMSAGTPLLGIPLQQEQDLNVTLIERRGAGRWLTPHHATTTTRLTALADDLLTDPRYRRAAGEIGALYATIDGPANAATAILDGLQLPPVIP
ncbi:nucleotide disphospho-sugar-binding domain-containing protein [Actinoplanes sp. NPDC051851]|uniref:glycosyltransferase n=1 Tax=Actinoplanes sp. NPDC051851 TaxID=3154753 RepID=UPI0034238A53